MEAFLPKQWPGIKDRIMLEKSVSFRFITFVFFYLTYSRAQNSTLLIGTTAGQISGIHGR
jgi:hypothetical protein